MTPVANWIVFLYARNNDLNLYEQSEFDIESIPITALTGKSFWHGGIE